MEIHNKKALALERLILFSDAVFGIAITLLVIELKVPHISEFTERELVRELTHLIPHFMSFVLSFFIIGIYWVAHHRMFRYVVDFDYKLLWLNLVLLFGIVLMPFSSNLLGVYGNLNTAYYLYFVNITIVAALNFLIYTHISNPEKKLSVGLEDKRLVNYYRLRACIVPICFGIGILMIVLVEDRSLELMSRMSPILIWPAMMIVRKKYRAVLEKEAAVGV